MTIRDLGLLADENLDADVIEFLRSQAFDVVKSVDLLPAGSADVLVLQASFGQRRVVVTHDRDFGSLAIASKQQFLGIVFLRPGHIRPSFTIESLRTLLARGLELNPPFIIVAEHLGEEVHIRIRQPIA